MLFKFSLFFKMLLNFVHVYMYSVRVHICVGAHE